MLMWYGEYIQIESYVRGVAEQLGTANRTQAVGILFKTRGHADARPATDTGEDADELLALVLVGKDIADDSGRRLELEQLLVDILFVNALEIALERAVADDTPGRDQRATPHGELLGVALHDLPGARIPHDEIAHVLFARRRIHRKGRANEGLPSNVI